MSSGAVFLCAVFLVYCDLLQKPDVEYPAMKPCT